MAISFSQPSPIPGVTVTYNVILSTSYDPIANTTAVQLGGYVNSNAAESDPGYANAIQGQGFTFPGQLAIIDVENAIIALPAWSGATIVN